MNNEFHTFIDETKISSARQVYEYSKKRNPIIETNINTSKSTELINTILNESRIVQKKAELRDIIIISISGFTLFATVVIGIVTFIFK